MLQPKQVQIHYTYSEDDIFDDFLASSQTQVLYIAILLWPDFLKIA